MRGENTQQQTKSNAEYRFVTTKLVMFVFFYINAVQHSPVYSQGNDFVISVKYIENEISGNTKCAQTWQDF